MVDGILHKIEDEANLLGKSTMKYHRNSWAK